MAFFRGEEGSVKFSKDGTAGELGTVVSTTGWSFDMTKDTIECTAQGDDSRKYVGSLISGSGTVDFLYTAPAVADATAEFFADVLQGNDETDALFELFTSGSKKVSFNGIVTGASLSAATGDIQTASVSFITSGTIDVSGLSA